MKNLNFKWLIFIFIHFVNLSFGVYFYFNYSKKIENYSKFKENYFVYIFYIIWGYLGSFFLNELFIKEFFFPFYKLFTNKTSNKKIIDYKSLGEKIYSFFIYSLFVFIYMYYGKDTHYIPSIFGGKNLTIKFLEENMFNHIPHNMLLFVFFFEIGHHIYKSYHHTKYGKGQFIIMTIHHNITIYLMIYTGFFRYYFIGMNISFLHDIGDVFLNIGKFFYQAGFYRIMQIISMVLFFFSWIITRDYSFLENVYSKIFYTIFLSKNNSQNALFLRNLTFYIYILTYSILSILVILNFIWTYDLGNSIIKEIVGKKKKIN